MDGINDFKIMAALGRHMSKAIAQQVVATGNLANLDTPGYHTRDVAFDDLLLGEMQKLELTAPASGNALGAGAEEPQVSETDGLTSRRDGNNVQLDRELLNMTKASADFSAAQTALSAKFRLIRYAINEGR